MHIITQLWTLITSHMSWTFWLSTVGSFIFFKLLNFGFAGFQNPAKTSKKNKLLTKGFSNFQLFTLALNNLGIVFIFEYASKIAFPVFFIIYINQLLPWVLMLIPHKTTLEKTPYEPSPDGKTIHEQITRNRNQRLNDYETMQFIINIMIVALLICVSYYYMSTHNYQEFIKLIKTNV